MQVPTGNSLSIPKATETPEPFSAEDTDMAEQKRRAGISDSKKAASNTLGGGSGSDTTILKKNILGV